MLLGHTEFLGQAPLAPPIGDTGLDQRDRLVFGGDLPATTTSVAQTLSSPDVVTRVHHVWLIRSRLWMPLNASMFASRITFARHNSGPGAT